MLVNIKPDSAIEVAGTGTEEPEVALGSGKGDGKDGAREALRSELLDLLPIVNEVYIKTDPVEKEVFLSSDAADGEVIMLEAQTKGMPTYVSHHGVVEKQCLSDQLDSIGPPLSADEGYNGIPQRRRHYNQVDGSWRSKFEQKGLKIGLSYLDVLEDTPTSSITIEVVASGEDSLAIQGRRVVSDPGAEDGQVPLGKSEGVGTGRGPKKSARPSPAAFTSNPLEKSESCPPSSLSQCVKKSAPPSLDAITSNPSEMLEPCLSSSLNKKTVDVNVSMGGQGDSARNTEGSTFSDAVEMDALLSEKRTQTPRCGLGVSSLAPVDVPLGDDQCPGATVPGWFPVNPPLVMHETRRPGDWNSTLRIPIRQRKRKKKRSTPSSSTAARSNLLKHVVTSDPGSTHPEAVGTGRVSGVQGCPATTPDDSAASFVVIGGEPVVPEKKENASPQSLFAIPSDLLQIPMTTNHGSLQPRVVGIGLVPGGRGSAVINRDGGAADFVVVGDTSVPEKKESPSLQSLISIQSDLLKIPVTSNCSSLQPRVVGITQGPGDQGHAVRNRDGTACGFVVIKGTSVPEKVGSQCFPGMMLPSLGCGNNVTLISGNNPTLTKLRSGQAQPSLMPFPVGTGQQGSVSIPLGGNLVLRTCMSEGKGDSQVPTSLPSLQVSVGGGKIVRDPTGGKSFMNNHGNYKVPIPRLGPRSHKDPIKILPKLSGPQPSSNLLGVTLDRSGKGQSGSSVGSEASGLTNVRMIPTSLPPAAGQQRGFIVQSPGCILPIPQGSDVRSGKNMFPSSVGQLGNIILPLRSFPAQTSQGGEVGIHGNSSCASKRGAAPLVQTQGDPKCVSTGHNFGVLLNASANPHEVKVIMQPPLSLVEAAASQLTSQWNGSLGGPLTLYKLAGLEKDGKAPGDASHGRNLNGRQPIGYLLGGSALNFGALVAGGGVGGGKEEGAWRKKPKRWKGGSEEAASTKNRFRCGVCDLVFFGMDLIDEHMTMHMRVKWNWCLHCWERFKHKNELQYHIHRHVGAVPPRSLLTKTCRKCGVSVLRRNFAVHEMVHSGERPFVCDECGKSFRTRGHLKSHLLSHQDVRPFECGVCGKRLKRKSALRSHLLTHSSQALRFSCGKCNCRFPTLSRLRIHEVSHSEERNVPCNVCRKSFKTKCQMREHAKRHVRMWRYECLVCGRRFKEAVAFRKHQKRLKPCGVPRHE